MFRSIYLVYKESILDHYSSVERNRLKMINPDQLVTLKKSHEHHYASLEKTKILLRKICSRYKISLKMHRRRKGRTPSPGKNDLVISLGGDGTFIYASHIIKESCILGINSAPDSSVGHYCTVNIEDEGHTEKIICDILNGKRAPILLDRLSVFINGRRTMFPAINDILVADRNPASTSRYILHWNQQKDSQKSSGIWIATQTGSTAAYKSASGKHFSSFENNRKFGFAVRELYHKKKNSIQKGIVAENEQFMIQSLMLEGVVYFDGTHDNLKIFPGDKIEIRFSKYPLRAFYGK